MGSGRIEYVRAKKEIEDVISLRPSWRAYSIADDILDNVKSIAILADDQHFPPNPYTSPSSIDVYNHAVSEFRKAGFRRIIT